MHYKFGGWGMIMGKGGYLGCYTLYGFISFSYVLIAVQQLLFSYLFCVQNNTVKVINLFKPPCNIESSYINLDSLTHSQCNIVVSFKSPIPVAQRSIRRPLYPLFDIFFPNYCMKYEYIDTTMKLINYSTSPLSLSRVNKTVANKVKQIYQIRRRRQQSHQGTLCTLRLRLGAWGPLARRNSWPAGYSPRRPAARCHVTSDCWHASRSLPQLIAL